MSGADTDDRHVLVMAAENRYAMPMGVALRSIQERLDPALRLDIFVLDGGIGALSRRRLASCVDFGRHALHWIRPDRELVKGLPVFGHIRSAAYFRVLIPELLPTDVQRAVYIDCDVIALGDISPLWRQPFDGHVLLAVNEGDTVLGQFRIHEYEGIEQVDPSGPYLNSGVLVFDMEAWRQRAISREVIACLKVNHERVQFWDQDGLNAVLAGRWRPLPRALNYRVDCAVLPEVGQEAYLDQVKAEAVLLHFAAALKPWAYYCDHPAKRLFYDELKRTPWRRFRPRVPLHAYRSRHFWGAKLRGLPLMSGVLERR